MFWCVLFLAVVATAQGRAVNISNTWVLPEEGFPVFYRYFRDRISWYEADAVCQFHHANLVTVDTTSQYDAVRAYLKELDISSAVWVGLIRSNPDGEFTWTDYRGLSGDGYWSSAPDARAAPLCAAADPAADYRWEARACGGPTVASFICELPVPQWALGSEGCMVRNLPALTALYLPESAAVQLTTDCGLAGTKRVQCTGSVKREELLKNLSCEEDEASSTPNIISISTSESAITDTAYTDQDTTNDITTEDKIEVEQTTEKPSTSTTKVIIPEIKSLPAKEPSVNRYNTMLKQKDIHLDLIHNDNKQSNDIPKLAHNDNFLTAEQSEKLEDEKHMHYKMLHDELAKHGNFETIFTQPTDHFVPPLVMAKAKISDDMTVLSLAEKHAQQLVEQRFSKHIPEFKPYPYLDNNKVSAKQTTEITNQADITEKPFLITSMKSYENNKKDNMKPGSPKKYKEKYMDPKGKAFKINDNKFLKSDKSTEIPITQTDIITKSIQTTTTNYLTPMPKSINEYQQDESIDLTVMLKELGVDDSRASHYSSKSNATRDNKTVDKQTETEPTTTITTDISTMTQKTELTTPESIVNTNEAPIVHQVIRITVLNDDEHSTNPSTTVFEVTTKAPEFVDITKETTKIPTQTMVPTAFTDITTTDVKVTNQPSTEANTKDSHTSTSNVLVTELIDAENLTTKATKDAETEVSTTTSVTNKYIHTESTKPNTENIIDASVTTISSINNVKDETTTPSASSSVLYTSQKPNITINKVANTSDISEDEKSDKVITTAATDVEYASKDKIDVSNYTDSPDEDYLPDKNITDSSEIDDFQSPLLSGANEPAPRPNRSRRPPQPKINKFNPFRILG